MFPSTIHGLIRRRLLINYSVDPHIASALLPPPFEPKLHNGRAVAGLCLIRLEAIRPAGIPAVFGLSSENAAHRMAVTWRDASGIEREGVFIPRRDTSSRLNSLVGGRFFPGEHRLAAFHAQDDGLRVAISIRSRDGEMKIDVEGRAAEEWPEHSIFDSLAEASAFFASGRLGYSATQGCCALDGLELTIPEWHARPLAVDRLESSFFSDPHLFPPGSISFDHALVMRDIEHEWRAAPRLETCEPVR